ncbi:uncharacterized protein BHQ10_001882 [Talaromyces amestolkiae]|uniref:ubiquitinyl hydrolase 1 n=1 Tax=Talaromyces amestolkiae TaxID=1196081 RepID=A0A364KQP3_TALAM|nr:uncharacterized protein BHQ10_001882 [Talaromyces amestolkiae]RAO65870.1 hypothetical protein BHQ10_001882 [Talaromyces amestolkiae]
MTNNSSTLELTFNHLAFPPKLPGTRDPKVELVERDILTRLRTAVHTTKAYSSNNDAMSVWESLEGSLEICQFVNENGFINREALESTLRSLNPDHTLILHVTQQNAGLIIRSSGEDFIFESFEASPSAEQTLAAKGAMQWDFPTVAVSLPRQDLVSPQFQENLTYFLEGASLDAVDEFTAKTHKAGIAISEPRDTTHPALITDFLMTLLEVNGTRANLPLLRKRVKDDVCWDNAELPWRRSPFWLILRVAVQRSLYLAFGEQEGRPRYKFLLCVLMSQLLTDCVQASFNPELCNFLRAKLCRRLAKLETEKLHGNSSVVHTYSELFESIGPICRKAIDMTTTSIEKQWVAFKAQSLRKIPSLPPFADEDDLHLTLPNSGSYLRGVLNQSYYRPPANPSIIDAATLGASTSKATTEFYSSLLARYNKLQDWENQFETTTAEVPQSQSECSKKCQSLAKYLLSYLEAVGDAYDGNSEQMSIFILNVFETWVYMDQCALKVHPLLSQYHPFFEPGMLDVLLLTRLHDMKRLQAIQEYISKRCTQAERLLDIFADPQQGYFADQIFTLGETGTITKLDALHAIIETASGLSRATKEGELQKTNDEYKNRTENMMRHSCTQRRNPDGTHDIRGCTHCWHVRSRRRLKIEVHEDFLPSEDVKRKNNLIHKRAILFELDTPPAFSAYRTATWEIIQRLSCPIPQNSSIAPEMLLKDYPQLKTYYHDSGNFSLASTTKSFLGTHYNFRFLPTTLAKVLMPFGPTFYSYYDSGRKIWAKSVQRPLSLAHHFALRLPKEFPFSTLYSSADFAADGNGPSSYDTIASIAECPSDLTVHEYTAHQSLVSGKHRRWLSILIELGSSNVNFSLQDTMILFQHLILQAGPMMEHDDLRTVNAVFRDVIFCRKLLDQIEQHIKAISQNWRENYYMETLLTLVIRVCTLGHKLVLPRAQSLLTSIRNITLTWINTLRHEMRTTQEHDVAERSARYGFLAALLCRRTFYLAAYDGTPMDQEHFKAFVEATLAMQENLVVDVTRFTDATLNMLIRDIKMTYRMKSAIRHSVHQHPLGLQSAIDTVWPNAASEARQYGAWKPLDAPYEWWVTSTVSSTENTISQVVHYHLLEGHLLIDGRALGKLPPAIRDSTTLKELFGNQRLVAFPSNVYGMSYVLGIQQDNHDIHLGFRGSDLVVQARKGRDTKEFVPSHVFGSGFKLDLPRSLIDDIVHWVDLRSGILEARRRPKIWRNTMGNWNIDLRTYRARRHKSTLVNPQSRIFGLISQIFRDFVPAPMLTVYQPLKGTLVVEIKSMDLMFRVNRQKLLHCEQLGSEIDPNQDPGTFYGLRSMIVLRDASNPSQRSLLTTLGPVKYRRSGVHVEVYMENDGRYAKYSIDSTLGRLHCPPEPRLLYTKAQLHAYTSFVVPDPLTGHNGTEEALHCLQSSSCQPWNPLIPPLVAILQTIAELSPTRSYYPKDLRKQQSVSWNPNLTTTIQHDAYRSVIDSIVKKSERLWLFHAKVAESEIKATEAPPTLLCERSYWRRSIYERLESLDLPTSIDDFIYNVRGKWRQPWRASNTREIVSLLRHKPESLPTTHGLKDIMRTWPLIGGYENSFAPRVVGDWLGADLAQEWGGLVKICGDKSREGYSIMFILGLMAFADGANMEILRTLSAFSILQDLKALNLPNVSSLSGPRMDQAPLLEELISLIRPFCEVYKNPISSRGKRSRKDIQSHEDARQAHELKCSEASTSFAKHLLRQWPNRDPSADEFSEGILNKYGALDAVVPYWHTFHDALQFSKHISEVQTILDRHHAKRSLEGPMAILSDVEVYGSQKKQNAVIPHLFQLLSNRHGKVSPVAEHLIDNIHRINHRSAGSDAKRGTNQKPVTNAEIRELEKIVTTHFVHSDSYVQSSYGRDLTRSIDAFKRLQPESSPEASLNLENEIMSARKSMRLHHNIIQDQIQDARYTWLSQANLWPSLSPISILEHLRSHNSFKLQSSTKKELVDYATSISKVQHLRRMENATLKRDRKRLNAEQGNRGYINWVPGDFPDWLLLEIDANIHIRKDQVNVALEMISPTSGSNSVLQMNMGQGKTSVIMPMVACVLANREMLTRLLVPDALLSQTAQILQSRLGGLVGREITHIPFSRRTPTTENHIQEYRRLHEEMLHSGGIILTIPEHVLSFKLCGLQRISDGKIPEAKQMVAIQGWMNEVCRDILDECDFTLATKTQLVYPSGTLLNVDGHPDRWKVTEFILDLIAHHLRDLAQQYPRSIDVVERGESAFPITHILRKDVEQALIQKIVDDICASRTPILSLWEYTFEQRRAIRTFISQEEIEETTIRIVNKTLADTPVFRKIVYLIRGLLVHGILLLCLKKRWNVQYGLHPRRDPVAVPFHAKGVPSEQAEWGHPDVAILFTCLAFYYQGLDQKQLRQSLQLVLKSDDPATEYDQWTQASTSLPEALRHWNIINIDDEGQVAEIWRHLRFATVVVNHFLNHFVFPAHAKQFSIKLQASGWDVPLFSFDRENTSKGSRRPGVTTGFSGTNDSRNLLPLTIKQHDLPGLLHTNAEVLTYLLQERNRGYVLATNRDGRRFSEHQLLEHLNNMKIRVLIDAGAFILEMDNRTLVKEWLQLDYSAHAAVYFGSDNKAWVQYRAGKIAPLLATPFADNLDGCLVYLDQAHTRGTDLLLPVKAKGALTLGPNQTKDHTVQAAMRLRQLGTTQSIAYIVPPEVHQSIQDVCNKRTRDLFDSSDVVTWLLHQTCNNIEELQPLYLSQGKDFCNRMQAAKTYKDFLVNRFHQEAFMEVLQQPEQQNLEQLYRPGISPSSEISQSNLGLTGQLVAFQKDLRKRQLASKDAFSYAKSSALEEVEQEREVAFQVEEEREVQRPSRMRALQFAGLHKTIREFVTTGALFGQEGYTKATTVLERTKVGTKYGNHISRLLGHLYVSTEFLRTVRTKDKDILDNYTRPVNWILWSEVSRIAMVIIPEEAEEVIPMLRAAWGSPVHLLLYAAPVTRKMLQFDALTYYASPNLPFMWKPPTWLPFELAILSGRLYFNFSDYEALLQSINAAEQDEDRPSSSSDDQASAKNVLAFLNEWLAIRRQGQDITHTPMGYVCQGRKLRSDHPFFVQRSEQVDLASGFIASYQTGVNEEEEDDFFDDDDEIEGSVGGDSCKEEENEVAVKEEEDDDVKGVQDGDVKGIQVEYLKREQDEKVMKEEVNEVTEEDNMSVTMDTSSEPSIVYS